MESAVDSSFFWGYLVTQVPGGFLASVYPANRIFGTAIACSAFLNLFLPGAFELPGVIILIRVMQGLVEVNLVILWFEFFIDFAYSCKNQEKILDSFVTYLIIKIRYFI
jgi:MFS family permease